MKCQRKICRRVANDNVARQRRAAKDFVKSNITQRRHRGFVLASSLKDSDWSKECRKDSNINFVMARRREVAGKCVDGRSVSNRISIDHEER